MTESESADANAVWQIQSLLNLGAFDITTSFTTGPAPALNGSGPVKIGQPRAPLGVDLE